MKVLITGASSGIGRDMAIYLKELGHEVIIVGSNKEKLDKVSKKLDFNKKQKLSKEDSEMLNKESKENNFFNTLPF